MIRGLVWVLSGTEIDLVLLYFWDFIEYFFKKAYENPLTML